MSDKEIEELVMTEWNTYMEVENTFGQIYQSQVRLGEKGWEKKYLWINVEFNDKPWMVESTEGIEAFHSAEKFKVECDRKSLSGVIILKKNMTSADVLDAYLNGVHTIPIDLNKETKNDIQSN